MRGYTGLVEDASNRTRDGYRSSHLGKGTAYHAEFLGNPRRALMWALERKILDVIVKGHFGARPFTHLDFACGTGRVIAYLESRASESVGVDLSPSMLEVAKGLVNGATLIEADLTREDPMPSRRFDLVTVFRFFPNAESILRDEALAALVSRLSPGGCLVFNNHCHTGGLNRRLVRLLRGSSLKLNDMSWQECAALIERHGLRIVSVHHAGVMPDYETRLLRPRWLVALLERAARRLPLARIAENLVFVCVRDTAAGEHVPR